MQAVEPVSDIPPDECERQLAKVLASQEFAGSRQLQDFLSYVASAAFANRKHIDQIEIARHVLNRGEDFNPVDDASVRKLATLTRQRLERYYTGTGVDDSLLISLPPRSYIPTFQKRTLDSSTLPADQTQLESAQEPAAEKPVPAARRVRLSTALLLCLAGLATGPACVWLFLKAPHTKPVAGDDPFRFQTVYGDFMHDTDDISNGIIHMGPSLGAADEVSVRMRFRPERALHQAGVLVLDNTNHYVKLGRQFESRPQLEFGMEVAGHYQKTPYTFRYDLAGQNGEPVWLSIRRQGDKFFGYSSIDGNAWHPVGQPLELTAPMRAPRLALFASNGRTNAPSIEASFDHLSYGLAFHSRPNGPVDLTDYPGWHMDSSCRVPVIDDGWLSFLSQGDAACRTAFLHALPAGDWSISAMVDCLPVDGNIAALVLRGRKGEVRLIRWDISGAAVTFEHLQHGQANLPDFAGSPPLILRLTCTGGVVSASFSRDDKEYSTLPLSVSLSEIGPNAEIGLQAGRSTWTRHESQAPRFAWIRFAVSSLTDLR